MEPIMKANELPFDCLLGAKELDELAMEAFARKEEGAYYWNCPKERILTIVVIKVLEGKKRGFFLSEEIIRRLFPDLVRSHKYTPLKIRYLGPPKPAQV